MCKDIMFLPESSPGISLVFTVNPLFRPPPPPGRGIIYFNPIWGGLLEMGGLIWERCLFNFETMMVSVLHEELEYKMEKLKYKKF